MAETAAGSRDENGSSGQLQLQRTDCAGDSHGGGAGARRVNGEGSSRIR